MRDDNPFKPKDALSRSPYRGCVQILCICDGPTDGKPLARTVAPTETAPKRWLRSAFLSPGSRLRIPQHITVVGPQHSIEETRRHAGSRIEGSEPAWQLSLRERREALPPEVGRGESVRDVHAAVRALALNREPELPFAESLMGRVRHHVDKVLHTRRRVAAGLQLHDAAELVGQLVRQGV